MVRYLLDTNHFTHYEHGHPHVVRRLVQVGPFAVGVSAVTVEESMAGRLSALSSSRNGGERVRRYELLVGSVLFFQSWAVVPFNPAAEARFQTLRGQRLRVSTSDLRVAAIALSNNLIVVTANVRDFGRIPGLVTEDWSV